MIIRVSNKVFSGAKYSFAFGAYKWYEVLRREKGVKVVNKHLVKVLGRLAFQDDRTLGECWKINYASPVMASVFCG